MKNLTLLFFLSPFLLFAQGNLSGKITNLSGEPFGYCKLILARDSVALQTSETDSLGAYSIQNITNGNYQLTIKIPFKKIDTLITVNGSTLFNLEIEDGNTLSDVQINGNKPTVIKKVDRTIFDPSSIPALVGGNAADVIEFAPGVFINGDNIQLANGNSADVMINDKPIPMTGSSLIAFIKAIPTEDIQYIEIVPIPPVKYAAGSVGSFINIKLVAGSKSRYSKGGITAEIGQRFYSQQALDGNYALRRGKLSLYSTLSLNNSKWHPAGTKTINYDTLDWNEQYSSANSYLGIRGSFGLNYDLSPTTQIGVLGFYTRYFHNNRTYNGIVKTNHDNAVVGTVENYSDNIADDSRTAINANLTKQLDTLGRKIDFNLDYTNYAANKDYNYSTFFQTFADDSIVEESNQIVNGADFISGGIDYTHPLKTMSFSLGTRYSYTQNDNHLSVFKMANNSYQQDPSKSNRFIYQEHIQAVYGSLDWKIKRFSFQTGVRVENTSYSAVSPTTNETFSNQYLQFVPKIFVMYETKKGNVWNMNYSRDFDRPYYNDLNPFKYYTSQFSYTTGNPALQPNYRHSVSISTGIKDFEFSFYGSYHLNGSNSITIYEDSTQTQRTTYANYYTDKSAALVISYFKTIKKRLNVDAMLYTGYGETSVSGTVEKQELNLLNLSANLGLRYTLDKKQTFFLSMGGFYMTPFYQQISKNTEGIYTSFSLTKNLLNNRMNLKLWVSDPFRLMNSSSITVVNGTRVSTNYYYDMQSIYFSFTYKFGNNRLDVNQHSTNATGEAGRIGK